MARDDEEFYDDYDDERRTWPLRLAAFAVLAVGMGAFVWFGLLPNDDGGQDPQFAAASAVPPSVDDVGAPTSAPDRNATSNAEIDADDVDGVADDASENDRASTVDPDDVTIDSADTAATSTVPADSPAAEAAPVDAPAPAPVEAAYPTLPDGSPVPVLAIYDGELITLSGAVPSDEAAQRLQVLALANSTVEGAEVASFLTIEPTVPLGVGVRVIEMNSARFPEGSPTVSLEHGAQLDRIAAVMAALPHLTVDVIGHSDQRGDEATNFALSADRARAAADYLSFRGIDPSRLSSRGAGESDLLTLNNDEAALALNRRTEFVFHGLLVDPPAPA